MSHNDNYDTVFSSVTQSCPTLCDRMDYSTPGFPVHHRLPELTQTHVHWVSDCHLTISSSVVPFSSRLRSFPVSGSFPMSQFFASGGQSIGVYSFSLSPSNEYSGLIFFRIDWFDLLAVQGTLKSSPAPQFEGINSSMLSLLYGPTLISIHGYWKNQSFDYMDLCWQSDVSAF